MILVVLARVHERDWRPPLVLDHLPAMGMVAIQVLALVLERDSRGMVVDPSRILLGVSLGDSGVDRAVGVGLLVDSLFSLGRVSFSQGDVFSMVSWTTSRGIALF